MSLHLKQAIQVDNKCLCETTWNLEPFLSIQHMTNLRVGGRVDYSRTNCIMCASEFQLCIFWLYPFSGIWSWTICIRLETQYQNKTNNHLDNNLQIWWPIMSIHHLCGFTCSGEMYRMHVKSLSVHIISCNSSHLCMIYYDKQTICHHIDWCESLR